mmetsp:Transcript_58382/g.102224  ORF Transcript_58382/g.102224 Transcript_58382/m.102224 type:complete len:260 (-) Transcript_58382:125-904(-)
MSAKITVPTEENASFNSCHPHSGGTPVTCSLVPSFDLGCWQIVTSEPIKLAPFSIAIACCASSAVWKRISPVLGRLDWTFIFIPFGPFWLLTISAKITVPTEENASFNSCHWHSEGTPRTSSLVPSWDPGCWQTVISEPIKLAPFSIAIACCASSCVWKRISALGRLDLTSANITVPQFAKWSLSSCHSTCWESCVTTILVPSLDLLSRATPIVPPQSSLPSSDSALCAENAVWNLTSPTDAPIGTAVVGMSTLFFFTI